MSGSTFASYSGVFTRSRGGSAPAPGQLDELARLRLVDRPAASAPSRPGGRRSTAVGYFFRSSPRIDQHQLVFLVALGLAMVVRAEGRVRGPAWSSGMSRSRSRSASGSARRGEEPADVPELAEVAAALVGGVLAPQQFAGELVVEPDHVRLDELLVGLEQRDAVVLDQLDVRQEELARELLQRLVHRHVDLGIDHHLAERVGGQSRQPSAIRRGIVIVPRTPGAIVTLGRMASIAVPHDRRRSSGARTGCSIVRSAASSAYRLRSDP